jgi:hypothetical protein
VEVACWPHVRHGLFIFSHGLTGIRCAQAQASWHPCRGERWCGMTSHQTRRINKHLHAANQRRKITQASPIPAHQFIQTLGATPTTEAVEHECHSPEKETWHLCCKRVSLVDISLAASASTIILGIDRLGTADGRVHSFRAVHPGLDITTKTALLGAITTGRTGRPSGPSASCLHGVDELDKVAIPCIDL